MYIDTINFLSYNADISKTAYYISPHNQSQYGIQSCGIYSKLFIIYKQGLNTHKTEYCLIWQVIKIGIYEIMAILNIGLVSLSQRGKPDILMLQKSIYQAGKNDTRIGV